MACTARNGLLKVHREQQQATCCAPVISSLKKFSEREKRLRYTLHCRLPKRLRYTHIADCSDYDGLVRAKFQHIASSCCAIKLAFAHIGQITRFFTSVVKRARLFAQILTCHEALFNDY